MRKEIIIFLAVILLTVFLRIFRLDSLPPSLNWDEVSIGYNAYSVLKTGQDEWGNIFPISFRAFGDYKLPGYIYLDVPFVAILGLNEWSPRIPSVFLGTGLVIFVFLILKSLSKVSSLALWGAFLTAVTPWTLIFSRIALEANLALFLITTAFYFFIKGLKRTPYLFLSAIILGLSIFSYNSARVVTPLLLILEAVIFFKRLASIKKAAILALFVFLAFFLIAAPLALLQDSSARYRWTAILDEGAIQEINHLRGSSNLPQPFDVLTYNRATYFTTHALSNYISHFDPRFLFIKGGSHFQYSVPGAGLLYLITLPFLIFGLIKIFQKKEKFWLFIFGWLLIAPVPAALTRDSPQALRSILMTIPLLMITALGLDSFLNGLTGNKVGLFHWIGVSMIMISLIFFWQNYSGSYVKNYAWAWQYGYKQAVEFIDQESSYYDKIYFTKKYGEPHEFLLFYLKIDPEKYRHDPNLVRYKRSDWFWVDRFGKFEFVNDWEIKENITCPAKCLLVTSPGNYPSKSDLLEAINFPDGQRAFDIVRLTKVQ